MLQLGGAKRAVESFAKAVLSMDPKKGKKAKRSVAFSKLSNLAMNHGQSLSHQSDRSFPRLRFTSEILNATKKNGKDYPGIILCLSLIHI